VAFRKAFAFEHLLHAFLSVLAGVLLSIFVLMIRVRKMHKNAGAKQ